MTLQQVAEQYAVPVSRVRTWIRSGELLAVNVSRKAGSAKPQYRVTPDDLADFERARSTRPAAKAKRRKKRMPIQYV